MHYRVMPIGEVLRARKMRIITGCSRPDRWTVPVLARQLQSQNDYTVFYLLLSFLDLSWCGRIAMLRFSDIMVLDPSTPFRFMKHLFRAQLTYRTCMILYFWNLFGMLGASALSKCEQTLCRGTQRTERPEHLWVGSCRSIRERVRLFDRQFACRLIFAQYPTKFVGCPRGALCSCCALPDPKRPLEQSRQTDALFPRRV